MCSVCFINVIRISLCSFENFVWLFVPHFVFFVGGFPRASWVISQVMLTNSTPGRYPKKELRKWRVTGWKNFRKTRRVRRRWKWPLHTWYVMIFSRVTYNQACDFCVKFRLTFRCRLSLPRKCSCDMSRQNAKFVQKWVFCGNTSFKVSRLCAQNTVSLPETSALCAHKALAELPADPFQTF